MLPSNKDAVPQSDYLAAVDLFSGCGGLSLGLQRAGFRVVAAVEIDPKAQATYRLNHPSVDLHEDDIRKLDPAAMLKKLGLKPGELDLLAGCPPCQGFSRLRTKNQATSVHDPRNDLVGDFLRFGIAMKPKSIMMENVPALAEDGRFKRICESLDKLGYHYVVHVLDAADYGVPQRRKRLILLASRLHKPAVAAKAETRVTVREALAGIGAPSNTNDELHSLPERRSQAVRDLIALIPKDGGSRSDLPREYKLECHEHIDGFYDVYGRMAWDDVAPTITSGCHNPSKGRFLHPSYNRTITLREAALLQGFPKHYRFDPSHGKEAIALMIGNALPPPFVAAHARVLRQGILGTQHNGKLSKVGELCAEGLTSEQAAAAADTSAVILCIACAGSGKSQTLAYRIARLVSEGTAAAAIVAITFTDKAAASIKRRVAKVLAKTGFSPSLIGQMYIGTIHAFCQNVLGDADAVYRQHDVLDDNRFMLFLMSRYPELNISPLRGRFKNRYFETLEQVQHAWAVYRDEGLSMADIAPRDPEVGVTLSVIENCLKRDQFLDFASMVRLAADRARSDVRVRERLGKIRHLLVDEYQDVSGSQEELVASIHELGADIFVVGDDDQSIYGFRGAHVSNILHFQQRYSGVSEHVLATNFRSTRAIVAASNGFVASQLGPQRLHKDPREHVDLIPNHLCVHHFGTRPEEAEWVAKRIQLLLGTEYRHADGSARGLTPADFAILMRSTKTPEQDENPRHDAFTRELVARDIPYTLNAGGSVFDRPTIAALRETFIALETGALTRPQARQLIDQHIRPAYPKADDNKMYQVLSEWGRRIHAPVGAARQRLFPQALLVDLLDAFNVATSGFPDDEMRDIGLFSRMLQDVEGVYLSIDSTDRFRSVVRFLQQVAEGGYNVSTEDVVTRPDAVTVSTVHQVKGLEFPVVFVVDVVPGRFPGKRSTYNGLLPQDLMAAAVARGAYANTREAEARLFYTALTRAERYLHVTGAANLPAGKRANRQSEFAAALQDAHLVKDPLVVPAGLAKATPRQKEDEATLPTSFSDVKYYLRCPMDYRFRKGFGFSPPVPELFGYGRVVHVAIEKLHESFADTPPTPAQAAQVAAQNFHLKHVAPSRDPQNRPGAYEQAKNKAQEIAAAYVKQYASDFTQQRQVEMRFEIPAQGCLITGSIDLLMRYDAQGNVVEAHVLDFKTMEGGDNPLTNTKLDWRELSLQVQLYAKAARDVFGENAATGSIHLLKDNQRVEVPIDDAAVKAAIENVEWAVRGIIARDYPMRPSPEKCGSCDFERLCSKQAQAFRPDAGAPPPIVTPNGPMAAAAL